MKYLAFRLPDLAPLHNDVPLSGVTLSRGVNRAGVIECALDRARAYQRVLIEGSAGENVRVFTQPFEPPPLRESVTYSWAGEPHASESIKRVNGVEVARNYAFPLVSGSTQAIFAGNQDYPSPGEVEVLTTDETASSALPRIQRVNANETTPPIFPGQGYAMAVQVKHSRGLPVRVRAWFLDASGSHVRNSDGTYVESTEYDLSVISGTTPENAAYLGLQILVDSSVEDGPSVDGDLFWAKDLHVATATTEAEALAEVADYFDGDTPDVPAEYGIWVNTSEDGRQYEYSHGLRSWVPVQGDVEVAEFVELIRERGTLIVAWDGRTARGFIVETVEPDSEEQEQLRLQGFGHGAVLDGTRWSAAAENYIEEDPLNIVRALWEHSSSFADMIDVTVDSTRSPIRVGEEEREVEFTTGDGTDVAFETGPFRLNWWGTPDMGKVFDDLATETPFEWAEQTTMDMDSDAPPTFHIRLGYPRLEAPDRSETHHFEVGLNIVSPEPSDDEEHQFFSEVFVLGNGEGSEKRRGEAVRRNTGRLRTVRVIEEQGITSNRLADERARKAVETAEQDEKFWETITVLPHPAAEPGTYDVGDVITVKGDTAWGWHEQRCRIVGLSHTVADDTVTLTLERWQGG